MHTILVIGGNFGGLTSAMELKRKLKDDARVVVISKQKDFVYIPSLIWVPFGRRQLKDITFSAEDALKQAGIEFILDEVVKVEPEANRVMTKSGLEQDYDYLIVATGAELAWDVVPGLGPQAYSHSIFTPSDAENTYAAFQKFVDNPGPVVIGAVPGASCMGAGYEYLFNFDHFARKLKIRDKTPIMWITPEPELGNFGIGGIKGGETMLKAFLMMQGIEYRTNAAIVEVTENEVVLDTGERIPAAWKMLVPPFRGAKMVLNSLGLGDEKGFIPTNEGYQHIRYPNIFAAGLAVRVANPFSGRVPFGVPKTGFPTDEMAKTAVHNIQQLIKGNSKLTCHPYGKIPAVCVMDAGNREVIILGTDMFPPRKFAMMLPNMLGDFSKVLVEKGMLMKYRHGWSFLP